MVESNHSFLRDPGSDVVPPHLYIADAPAAFPEALAENDLHRFWRHGLPGPGALITTSEEQVEIVHRGEYNRDAGPDFRRAVLKINGELRHGDIEFHLDARDWMQHGHHLDPAYNHVVLHIALRREGEAHLIRRENGLPVPQILLDPHHLPIQEAHPPVIIDCPLARTSPEKIVATVRRAGRFRLQQKAGAFGEQLAQRAWDQAVHRSLAEALGYDKNQEAFRWIADVLPVELLFAEVRAHPDLDATLVLESLLFGAAGFLESRPQSQDEEIRRFVTARRELWERLRHPLRLPVASPGVWRFFRLRPANFPTRRLAGLARLLRRFYQEGIIEKLLSLLQSRPAARHVRRRELQAFFTVAADDFWRRHCDFESRAVTGRTPDYGDLVGRQRALDILVNVVVPALWQYGEQSGDAHVCATASELYGELPPLQGNYLTRLMAEQLSSRFQMEKAVINKAESQQGLIYLQRLLCRSLQCQTCLKLVAET